MIEVYEYRGKNEEECREKYIEELDVYNCDIITKESEQDGDYIIKLIKKEDITEYIKEYLKEFSDKFGISTNVEIRTDEENFNITLLTRDNSSILIGKDGRTLDSIQLLLRQTISNQTGFNVKINLDSSNYRVKKNKKFEFDIKNIVREVQRTKIDTKLEPMNSYKRRIVHSLLAGFSNVTTESVGEEPNRCVVIKYIGD